MKKAQTSDLIYFKGKNHFEEDGTRNCLVFQPMYRYFKRIAGVGNGNYIYFWKFKRLSHENITAPTRSDYRLNRQLSYLGNKIGVEFKRSCLKQDKIAYTNAKVVNIYSVCEISKTFNISSYSTPENDLWCRYEFIYTKIDNKKGYFNSS